MSIEAYTVGTTQAILLEDLPKTLTSHPAQDWYIDRYRSTFRRMGWYPTDQMFYSILRSSGWQWTTRDARR